MSEQKDLIVLAADQDMVNVIEELLKRHEALGIRKICADIQRMPEHDPGCATHGVDYLIQFADQYQHGLLIFDHEGSGKESTSYSQLKNELNDKFLISTWGGRAKTIIICPELETWLWSDSPHVDDILGWKQRKPPLRSWLIYEGWIKRGFLKPNRPKEAFELALKEANKPRSSSLFSKIERRVSFQRCIDPAFLELKGILKKWFPGNS